MKMFSVVNQRACVRRSMRGWMQGLCSTISRTLKLYLIRPNWQLTQMPERT